MKAKASTFRQPRLLLIALILLLTSTKKVNAFTTINYWTRGIPQRKATSSTTPIFSSVSSPAPNDEKKTLYEVLQAPSNATRSELKKCYAALARVCHPDALPQQNDDGDDETCDIEHDFTEIAAAWEILSNPKERTRYDRSLKAERFSEDIAQFVNKNAAPVTELSMNALEKIALPFLRRTTATTLATVQAAVKSKDLRHAMGAAISAGKAVDRLELHEKSQTLEEKAVAEYKRSVEYQTQLEEAAAARLQLTLHTENSGLTSSEALLLLERFGNNTGSGLFSGNGGVESEIAALQRIERDFIEQQRHDSSAQETFRNSVRERLLAQTSLKEAVRLEADLKERYEKAVRDTVFKREAVETAFNMVSTAEVVAQKSSFELERLSVMTNEQSEAVRKCVRKREMAVLPQLEEDEDYIHVPDSETPEENEERLAKLRSLRQHERELAVQAKQLELDAAKMLSRANKLKTQANRLEKVHEKQQQDQRSR